jgi:hypothetical protein
VRLVAGVPCVVCIAAHAQAQSAPGRASLAQHCRALAADFGFVRLTVPAAAADNRGTVAALRALMARCASRRFLLDATAHTDAAALAAALGAFEREVRRQPLQPALRHGGAWHAPGGGPSQGWHVAGTVAVVR